MTVPLAQFRLRGVQDKEDLHPIVRIFYEICREQDLTLREVAGRAGICPNTLGGWRRGDYAPSLLAIEKALRAVGYELEVVKLDRRAQ